MEPRCGLVRDPVAPQAPPVAAMMGPSGGLIHDRRQKRQLRVGLAALALIALVPAMWGLFGPRSFAGSFPGFGRAWPGLVLPYSEHLTRDVAAFYLGFAVLLSSAAVMLRKDLVQIALASWLVTVIAHLLSHAGDLERLIGLDKLPQMAALLVTVALPVALLFLTSRMHWRTWRAAG